jgi:hypothetical protein
MTIENLNSFDIERRISEIDFRLPNGVRKHIRRLKEEGKLDEAIRFREESLKSKKSAREKLDNEKKACLRGILSNDPQSQAFAAFELTWIINKIGEITDEERYADLAQVYINWPDQSDALEGRASSIVAQLSKLVKEASF